MIAMPPKPNNNPSVICAESISLLYLLHSVPTLPSRNAIAEVPHREQGYILSFIEESRLVAALAFLANTKEDVNHIPALCIQHSTNPPTLNVLLAVNRSSWNSGSQACQSLREGFQRIFALSAQSRRGEFKKISHTSLMHQSDDVGEQQILTEIISLCSKRILQRLRLVSGRWSNLKQPIHEALRVAITCLQQAGESVLRQHFTLSIVFVEKAKAVIRSCDAWKRHQTLPRLEELVQSIHNLKCIGNIEAMLNSLPNQAMCPSAQRSLYNIIRKVARYQELSRYLYRISKKYEAVRSMALTIVQLPQSAYSRPTVENHSFTVSSTFSRLNMTKQKQKHENIYRFMKVTEQEANKQFAAQTRKTISEAKIHAEVQLIYHIALNPSKLPPRVIASSKDACYLCNAFIQMQGKVHISRTHGRLYPSWRLPSVPKLANLEQRFNAVLKTQIRASIAILNQRGCRTVYPDPNESTLSSLPRSVSTLRSAIVSRLEVEEEVAAVQRVPPALMPEAEDVDTSSEEDMISVASTVKDEATVASNDSSDQSRVVTECSYSESSSSHVEVHNEAMAPDYPVVIDQAKTVHTLGPLELHIDASSREDDLTLSNDKRAISYSIRRLTVGEMERFDVHDASRVVDLDALQDETIHKVDDQGRLFVGARGVVIEISYR
jgi:hypothetical protein